MKTEKKNELIEEAIRFYLHTLEWSRNLRTASDAERLAAEAKIADLRSALKTL